MTAVFVLAIAGWIAGEARLTVLDQPSPGTLALPTGLLVLASHALGLCTGGGGSWWGAALLGGGIALRLAAIRSLGASFTSALGSEALIVRGPYRLARHPSELGLWAILFGGAWLLGSWWAAAAAIAVVPLSVLRCAREDAALACHPEHAAWGRRVGWFAPRIGRGDATR
ncbi:MAG: methyltransferase [Kofleriaceae bacterium]